MPGCAKTLMLNFLSPGHLNVRVIRKQARLIEGFLC